MECYLILDYEVLYVFDKCSTLKLGHSPLPGRVAGKIVCTYILAGTL